MATRHLFDIQAGTIAADAFQPAPIPAADVIEGQPEARSCDLSSDRTGAVSMNLWDCSAGSFRWYFANDELVQILDGEVHVTDEAGITTVLTTGSTAHFAPGTHMVWHVPRYVRKLAFHHAPANRIGRIGRRLQIRADRSKTGSQGRRVPVHLAALSPGLQPVLNGVLPLL